MFLLTLLLAACDRGCETATCLADQAVVDWPTDAAGVTARVVAVPDDLARTVVVGRLCEAFPGQTSALCAALPEGASRTRCERLNGRPHLGGDPTQTKPANPISGGAPIGAGSPPVPNVSTNPRLPLLVLPMPAAKAPPVACDGEADRGACLDAAAVAAVLSADFGRADATCSMHAEPRYADECRFHAAEEAVSADHQNAYAGAAALCTASASFAEECLVHVLSRLPRRVLPPYAAKSDTADVADVAARIRDAWAAGGGEVADSHIARFWALYFANSYRQTEAPDGTPLDTHPEEAWPHIRAAAAMRLRELERLRGKLPEQVATLEAALAHREQRGVRRGKVPDLVFVADLGVPVSAGPVTWFLGSSQRALGEDAATDVLFCVLESAARGQSPDRFALEEGAYHANPRVAAEAARLLAAVDAAAK
jgi:hypothetical protein